MRYPLLHRKKCRTTESSRDRASQKNSCGKQGPTATEVTHRANTFSLCLLLVCYHQLFLVFVFLIRQLFLTQKDVSHGSHRTRTHCLALLMWFGCLHLSSCPSSQHTLLSAPQNRSSLFRQGLEEWIANCGW